MFPTPLQPAQELLRHKSATTTAMFYQKKTQDALSGGPSESVFPAPVSRRFFRLPRRDFSAALTGLPARSPVRPGRGAIRV
jgi:hypothetical protein